MTAIQVTNLALLKIGVSKGIAALDEASREAWTALQVYDHVLRATLRRFPWPFATKYLPLTLVQGPAWTDASVQAWSIDQKYAVNAVVTHSATIYYCILGHSAPHEPPDATYWSTTAPERANGDWDYAYRSPSDCIFARRLVPPGGRGRVFNETPIPYREGRDSNGLLIYSNAQDAELEYTTIDCVNLWVDDLFLDAFTWRLAASLAPSLSKIEKMEQKCLAMFEMTIATAATVGAQEQQQEKPGDAEWINGR